MCIYIYAEVYTWYLRMDIVNVSFRFIGINKMYIVYNFCLVYFNVAIPLVQNFIISNRPLYGVSYLYVDLLLIMYLSPTL